jgi:hypothetical protein
VLKPNRKNSEFMLLNWASYSYIPQPRECKSNWRQYIAKISQMWV